MEELTEEEFDIVAAIKDFGETVKDLKSKRFRFTVVVSIAFAVVLTLILGIVAYILLVILPKIDDNASEAKRAATHADSVDVRIAESELTRCKAGNDFRENDKARWEFIIKLAGSPDTPEAQERIDKLREYIGAADAPKDCSALKTQPETVP